MNDDLPKSNLTFEESVTQVLQHLPPPIRRYLEQGKYSDVAKNLALSYSLHSDQAKVLEREILLLLMGTENPTEFSDSLGIDAHLDARTVANIMQDVNTQIFMPLREEMKTGGGIGIAPSALTQPHTSAQVPNYAAPQPPRQPIATPTPPPPQPRQWSNQMPPPASSIIQANPSLPPRPGQASSMIRRTAPLPRPSAQPRPFMARPNPAPQNLKPVMNTNRMLEDHEEPSPSLGAVVRSLSQPAGLGSKPPRFSTSEATMKIQVGSRSEPPPVPAQRVYTPPTNLPGMMPAAPAMPNITRPPAVPATPPPPVPLTPKPPVQPYSSDPYHEPIDESPA